MSRAVGPEGCWLRFGEPILFNISVVDTELLRTVNLAPKKGLCCIVDE